MFLWLPTDAHRFRAFGHFRVGEIWNRKMYETGKVPKSLWQRRFSTSISDDEERHFLCPTCCSVQGILLFLSGSFSLKKLYRIVTDTHKESSVRAHIDRRRCENNFHIAQEILTQKAIYSHSFSARMVQIVWHNQNIRAFLWDAPNFRKGRSGRRC